MYLISSVQHVSATSRSASYATMFNAILLVNVRFPSPVLVMAKLIMGLSSLFATEL